jgi:uridine kinase
MLDEDAIAKRLGQIIAVKKEITLADDRRAVRNIDRELEKLEKRIARWRKRLQPAAAKSLNGNGARASVRGVA